jgi:hypothetical protein
MWYNKGGTPAFQSAPLRGKLMWYNKGGMPAFQSAPLRGELMWYNAGIAPCVSTNHHDDCN